MDLTQLRKLAEVALRKKTQASQPFGTQYQQPITGGLGQQAQRSPLELPNNPAQVQQMPDQQQPISPNVSDPSKSLQDGFRAAYTPENPVPGHKAFQAGLTGKPQADVLPGSDAMGGDQSKGKNTAPEYLSREEWESITGAKDINELIAAFSPKPKEDSIKYHKRISKLNALGNALGSIGGMISASMGGPVQLQDRNIVHDNMEKANKYTDHYEAEKRAHEMMMLQNEIANRKGYGDHILAQKDLERQEDILRAKWDREDDQRSQKEQHDMNLVGARHQSQSELNAQKDAAAAKRTAATNASREKTATARASGKDEKKWKIYDPKDKNKLLHELDNDQKFRLEELVISGLTKRLDNGEQFDRRTRAVLEQRTNISAEDRWMLAQRYYNSVPAKDFLTGRDTGAERDVHNQARLGHSANVDNPALNAMRNIAAKRLAQQHNLSLEEAQSYTKTANPEQLRYILRDE